MTAHRELFDLFRAVDMRQLLDPGTSGTIVVDRSPCYVALVSAAAETRTLARPTRAGVAAILHLKTDGGDVTLTVTGGYNLAATTGYTFTDAGQVALFLSNYDGTNYFWRLVNPTVQQVPYETLTAARVIRADEAQAPGKTFGLSLAGGFQVTLPAPFAGGIVNFVVKTAPTTAYTIIAPSSATILYGPACSGAGGATGLGSGEATFSFVANQSLIGDWAEFRSDGTNWYVRAATSVDAGITIA